MGLAYKKLQMRVSDSKTATVGVHKVIAMSILRMIKRMWFKH